MKKSFATIVATLKNVDALRDAVPTINLRGGSASYLIVFLAG